MTTSPMPNHPPVSDAPRSSVLYNDLRQVLGMPLDRHRLGPSEPDRARELLPGWCVEIRVAEYPRPKGWWQCALDRAANHGGRPLLIYRIGEAPWHVVLAVRDLAPVYAHAPPQLVVQTSLAGLAAVIHSHPGP